MQAAQEIVWQGKVLQCESSLQADNSQALDIISQVGNQRHLHLSLGSHKQNLNIVAQASFQRLCNRNCRVDMTSGTSAGEDNSLHLFGGFVTTLLMNHKFMDYSDKFKRKAR